MRFNAVHPAQVAARADAVQSARWAQRDQKITAVIGPSGAGKSQLRRLVGTDLVDLFGAAAPFELVAPPQVGHHSFPMSAMLSEGLQLLGDPAPEAHVITTSRLPPGLPIGNGPTNTAKLYAFGNRLRSGSQAAVFLDEAGYLSSGTQRTSLANMRDLTWLAEYTGKPIVLFLTYEGIPLLNVADDINRRVRTVHLPRYLDDEAGARGFVQALAAFDGELARLRISGPGFRLTTDARVLWESSFGRIGVLADHVAKAAECALLAKRPLRASDFESTRRLLVADPNSFKQSTFDGERVYLDLDGPAHPAKTSMQTAPPRRRVAAATLARRPRRTRRVGERKPGHDPAFGAFRKPKAATGA